MFWNTFWGRPGHFGPLKKISFINEQTMKAGRNVFINMNHLLALKTKQINVYVAQFWHS